MQKRMLPLKALKPHLYGTRRMEAGDEYEAPTEEAIALVANGRAGFAKAKKPATAAPAVPAVPAVPQPEPEHEPIETPDSIDKLRLEATQLGVNIDGRWGARRLQYEIEQAKR